MEADVKEHRPKEVLKYSLLQNTWQYNLCVCVVTLHVHLFVRVCVHVCWKACVSPSGPLN